MRVSELIPRPKSKFIVVECPDCGGETTTFNKASITVKCLFCGRELVRPTGGKSEITGKVKRVLE